MHHPTPALHAPLSALTPAQAQQAQHAQQQQQQQPPQPSTPPTHTLRVASTTWVSFRRKRYSVPVPLDSYRASRASAAAAVITSPRYSATKEPLGIRAAAYMPHPCSGDRAWRRGRAASCDGGWW